MTLPRSPALFRLKSWAIMVNDRLFPAILRVPRYRRLPRCNCAVSCLEPTAELFVACRTVSTKTRLVVARPSPRFRWPEPDIDVNSFTFSIA